MEFKILEHDLIIHVNTNSIESSNDSRSSEMSAIKLLRSMFQLLALPPEVASTSSSAASSPMVACSCRHPDLGAHAHAAMMAVAEAHLGNETRPLAKMA